MASKFIRWVGSLPLKNKIIISCIFNLIFFNLMILVFTQTTAIQRIYCWVNILAWSVNLATCVFVRNINVSQLIMTIYGLVSIGFGAFVTGGIYSSYIFWFPIITQGVSIFTERAWALTCLIFSLACYTLFAILQAFGYMDFHRVAGEVPILLNYANFASCILMLWIIHYFFLTKERINFMWGKINEQKVEDLEHMLSQKEQEIEKMRNDMAKDFHDEMGNKLASISFLSQTLAVKLNSDRMLDHHEKLRMLETIELRAKEMYQGTKDFIWSVDYRSDFVLEIFIYLREFGEGFFNQIDIDFKSEYLLDTEVSYRLGPLVGRHCILICKEIMTNAAKYSGTGDFVFEMKKMDDTLQILLEDHGTGFDSAMVQKRGIGHVHQRCSQINALVGFASGAHGTRYLLEIPLERSLV